MVIGILDLFGVWDLGFGVSQLLGIQRIPEKRSRHPAAFAYLNRKKPGPHLVCILDRNSSALLNPGFTFNACSS
jgi:hypothetical protein